MIRAKVLWRKYSKRLSKPDLKATFSDVCLVKTELKSNDLRIQVFDLEKPYNKSSIDQAFQSRWLDIGQVLFLRVYGPRRSRGP